MRSFSRHDASFIIPRHTTLANIVQRLGAPSASKQRNTGAIVRYQFLDIKYFTVNLTRPLPFLFPALSTVPSDLYQFTISGGGIGTAELQIEFDRNWTVVHFYVCGPLEGQPLHPLVIYDVLYLHYFYLKLNHASTYLRNHRHSQSPFARRLAHSLYAYTLPPR